MHVLVIGAGALAGQILHHLISFSNRRQNNNSITIFDNQRVSIKDLASSFLLRPTDLGIRRSVAMAEKLNRIAGKERDETKKTIISAHVGDISFEFLHNFDVVIMSRSPATARQTSSVWCRKEMERINTFCRHRRKIDSTGKIFQSPVAFVATDVRGFMGYFMADFGNEFQVSNIALRLGFRSEIIRAEIDAKSHERKCTVLIQARDFLPSNLVTGSTVIFSAPALSNVSFPIKVVGRDLFNVDLDKAQVKEIRTDGKGSLKGLLGSTIIESKALKQCTFNSVRRRWRAGLGLDAKSAQVHLAFQAVLSFQHTNERAPLAFDISEAERVLAIAEKLNDRQRRMTGGAAGVSSVDTDGILGLSLLSDIEFTPLCSIVGAFVAGEIAKCGGEGVPLGDKYFTFSKHLPKSLIEMKRKHSIDKEEVQHHDEERKTSCGQADSKLGSKRAISKANTGKEDDQGSPTSLSSSSSYVVVSDSGVRVYSQPFLLSTPRADDIKLLDRGYSFSAELVPDQPNWVRVKQGNSDSYVPLFLVDGSPALKLVQKEDELRRLKREQMAIIRSRQGLSPIGLKDLQTRLGGLRVLIIGRGLSAFYVLQELAMLGVGIGNETSDMTPNVGKENKHKGGQLVLADSDVDDNARYWWNVKAGTNVTAAQSIAGAIESLPCSPRIHVKSLASVVANSLNDPYDVTVYTTGGIEEMQLMDQDSLSSISANPSKLKIIVRADPAASAASVELLSASAHHHFRSTGDQHRNSPSSDTEIVRGKESRAFMAAWTSAFCPSSVSECVAYAIGLHDRMFFSGPARARRKLSRYVKGETEEKRAKIGFGEEFGLFISQEKETFNILKRHDRLSSFEDCVADSILLLREHFHDDILASKMALKGIGVGNEEIFSWRKGMERRVETCLSQRDGQDRKLLVGRAATWSISMILDLSVPAFKPKEKAWLMTFGQREAGGLQWILDNDVLITGCWGGGKIRHKLRLQDGGRHSVVATWDGKTYTLYVNGKMIQQKEDEMAFDIQSNLLTICTAPALTQQACSVAVVDSVRILPICLLEDRVSKMYELYATMQVDTLSIGNPIGNMLQGGQRSMDENASLWKCLWLFVSSTSALLARVHQLNSTPGDKQDIEEDKVRERIHEVFKNSAESSGTSSSSSSVDLSHMIRALSGDTKLDAAQDHGTNPEFVHQMDSVMKNIVSSSSHADQHGRDLKQSKIQFAEPLMQSLTIDDTETKKIQVDFIAAVADLRARSFGLGHISRVQVEDIIRHSSSASSAAVAGVSGFVALQLYAFCAGELHVTRQTRGDIISNQSGRKIETQVAPLEHNYRIDLS